jgi:hypothetical protein
MLPRPRIHQRGLALLCRIASPMTRANRDVHLLDRFRAGLSTPSSCVSFDSASSTLLAFFSMLIFVPSSCLPCCLQSTWRHGSLSALFSSQNHRLQHLHLRVVLRLQNISSICHLSQFRNTFPFRPVHPRLHFPCPNFVQIVSTS